MKTTKLTVELVLVTPELANNYLRYNVKNRKISEKNLVFLTNEMKSGSFLENGESIVFDENNELKDGQHRLKAITLSGKSYYIPIVRGVKPISMATYDTGKNRSAGDVLNINGYKYSNYIAGLISSINKFSSNNSKSAVSTDNGRKTISSLTNQQVLEFCQDNYDWLKTLVIKSQSICAKQKPVVLTSNQLSLIAYMLGGEYPNNTVYEFLKHISGVSKQDGTATNYLFTKLYNSKINKEPLNFYWILGMTFKAYNYYIDGNPAVRRFSFKVTDELPRINK